LSVEIPNGKRTLIAGPNPAAGRALFRATAGAHVSGSGRIMRPPADKIVGRHDVSYPFGLDGSCALRSTSSRSKPRSRKAGRR
jgi:hypothetical protein